MKTLRPLVLNLLSYWFVVYYDYLRSCYKPNALCAAMNWQNIAPDRLGETLRWIVLFVLKRRFLPFWGIPLFVFRSYFVRPFFGCSSGFTSVSRPKGEEHSKKGRTKHGLSKRKQVCLTFRLIMLLDLNRLVFNDGKTG